MTLRITNASVLIGADRHSRITSTVNYRTGERKDYPLEPAQPARPSWKRRVGAVLVGVSVLVVVVIACVRVML